MQSSIDQKIEKIAQDRSAKSSCSRDVLAWFQMQLADTKLIPSVVQPLSR